jgi:hypothetical protein
MVPWNRLSLLPWRPTSPVFEDEEAFLNSPASFMRNVDASIGERTRTNVTFVFYISVDTGRCAFLRVDNRATRQEPYCF